MSNGSSPVARAKSRQAGGVTLMAHFQSYTSFGWPEPDIDLSVNGFELICKTRRLYPYQLCECVCEGVILQV